MNKYKPRNTTKTEQATTVKWKQTIIQKFTTTMMIISITM